MMPVPLWVLSAAAAWAVGFVGGCEYRATAAERDALEAAAATQRAVDATRQAQAAERVQRDAARQASAELFAAREAAATQEIRVLTKRNTEYVLRDPNATDCGLSVGGLQLYNAHARGRGLPETEAAAAGTNAGSIAASNHTVIEAIGESYARHHACLRVVDGLRRYIADELTEHDVE